MTRRTRPAHLKKEDRDLWLRVTATVTPLRPTDSLAIETSEDVKDAPVRPKPKAQAALPLTPFTLGQAIIPKGGHRLYFDTLRYEPEPIEPNRKRRLARERDLIEARLDLHGMTALAAQARVKSFIQQAFDQDYRQVLIITGKGMGQNGVLKRETPEWLADPALLHMVAGISPAHARHGGIGALYVALKRNVKP
jgi:DNA-nicking Smr family endonuclease